ncbi:HAAS domain-containing protein [Paenisporosarcina antarctica]|uniref:HAAS transmembrane region domain-containing protein n=1 Tax=Paenisporosarcina antarctica TaxID=417367 RepID=A0A4P6ZXW4_9BACL|nr:hypothetical protein [Paenisporosarcina antarctica]QBP40988.1 hypothetical protein E2636_07545 [Paenisporosarcina antarctica]
MLTTKSENFIDNLRLYLITSGKNENEVKDVTDELRDHLIESEKSGKSIDEIIEGTPEAYMESIKIEMKTDYISLVKNIPIFILGIIAYFIMGPSIRGEFELNIIQLIGFPIISVIGLLIYVVLFQQAGKKQYSLKKLFFIGTIAYSSVTILFIFLLLGSTFLVEPFYKASPIVNLAIITMCGAVFILLSFWGKTLSAIWIPALLFIPDYFYKFSNYKDETILIIGAASFVLIFIFMMLNLLIIDRVRKAKVMR